MAELWPTRRGMRLPNYDYAAVGGYFVTLCIQGRHNIFGRVEDGVMLLNRAGEMVRDVLCELSGHFEGGYLDKYVVMPNHIHFIWVNRCGGVGLSEVVQWMKIVSTNRYIRGVKESGWPAFEGKLWQRGFYDHVIRNETDYFRIAEYIANNPLQWHLDTLYREN